MPIDSRPCGVAFHDQFGPLVGNGRWNGLEAAGKAMGDGLSAENLVLRAFGHSGAAWPDAVCWQVADQRGLVLALARDSVADWLPPSVVGSLSAPAADPNRIDITSDRDLLRLFASDSHLLLAPVDNALLTVEVEAHRESWKIEDPYDDPETVACLLTSFGLQDRIGPVDGHVGPVLTADELALILRLLPFLHALRGTVQGAELALQAVLGCESVKVEDRQLREVAVPEPLRSRLGVSRIGVDLVPGATMRAANGYRIAVGPASEALVRSLLDPMVRRKIDALTSWLLPLGGTIEIVTVVLKRDRQFRIGTDKAAARLGLTSWTPPKDAAKLTEGPA